MQYCLFKSRSIFNQVSIMRICFSKKLPSGFTSSEDKTDLF